MPLYEYECGDCRQRFERIQKFSDPPLETCPSCGGALTKLLSSPAIQFKGSGWYITDYAKKSPSDSGKDARTPASGDGAKESGGKAAAKDSGSGSSGDSSSASASPSKP